MNSILARFLTCRPLTLALFLAGVLLFSPAVATAVVDISEVWIAVYHPMRAGTDHGYLVEVGLTLAAGSDTPTSVTITPKAGSTHTLTFDPDQQEYIYFDTGGFDPRPGDWAGTGYSPLSEFQVAYPDGTWTLAVTPQGGSAVNSDLPFQLSEPDAPPSLIFPVHDAIIHTGKPVVMFSNTCTDCTGYEAELASTADASVEKFFENFSIPAGKKPNAVAFAELGPNDGSSGTVDANGLAPGQYQAAVGLIKGSSSTQGSVSDTFEFFVEAFRFESGLFTVSSATSSIAALTEVGMTMRQVEQVPSAASYSAGWYFTIWAEGTDLSDAALYAPGSSTPIPLTNYGGGEFEYEEFLGSAVTRQDAFNLYKPTDGFSKYVLVVDGGKAMATLDFFQNDDLGPDAGFTFTNPADGDRVGATPTFNLDIDCTVCNYAEVSIEDVATEGDDIYMVSAAPPGTVPVGPTDDLVFPDDFGANQGSGGTITSLPAGDFLVSALVFRAAASDFDPEKTLARSGTDSIFEYMSGENVERHMIVVPEPGVVALQLAAFVSLGGIARWRRRRAA